MQLHGLMDARVTFILLLKIASDGNFFLLFGRILVRPNKKINVFFRVTGLKILGRVETHIFLILCILNGET